jgi:hypothetical protein
MKTAQSVLEVALIPAVLGLVGSASAQLPEAWAIRYTNGFSYARAATVDRDGNSYITGSSDNDYGTVKFNADGTLAWAATYAGHHGRGDGANAITVDSAGNVYVTGAASGNRFYYQYGTYKVFLTDCVTVKYDSTGHQRWASSYSESGNFDYAGQAIAVDSSGNVYIAGQSFLVKYAANGHQSWLLTGIFGVALAVDNSGNLYLTGPSTRKLDPDGNPIWSEPFQGGALILDGAGGLYVTGSSGTKKFDANSGAELWSANAGGTSLALDSTGNLFITGQASVGVTRKYSSSGTSLWVASTYYPGFASGVVVDGGGNAYVTGLAFNSSGSDYLTLKYDPNGNPLWVGRHNGTGSPHLGLDANGNAYVAGSDAGGAYLALKYVQPAVTGMPQIQSQPQDKLGFAGENVSYAVVAAGQGVLRYQWYYGGSLLVGSTNSALVLTNVGPNNVGLYAVEVGDSVGLTISTQANLVVVAPPASQSVLSGASVEFDAWTFGPAPATYQWQFNGADLPGAHEISLVLSNVSPAQAGDYRVVASAFSTSITSAPAHLAVSSLVRQNWVARYDDPANAEDRPRDMKLDAAGNLYVTGISDNYNVGYDYATLKYNANGQPLWTARYDGPGHGWDEARGLALDHLGNVYVTGVSMSTNGYPDWDAATIKYGPTGSRLWVARYSSEGLREDGGQSVTVDDGGNVYVAIYSGSASNGFDYVTIKYGPNGNQLWAARYDGPGHRDDFPYTIAVDATGNVYVTGESAGDGSDSDYATLKYDSAGNLLWAARYNGPANTTDYGFRLAVDAEGNVHVSGASIGSGSDYDIATLKYDSSGHQLWLARYNGPGNGDDEMRALALDNAGNVYVAGWAYITNNDSDYVTIKYGPDGQQRWLARYDGPAHGDDAARALTVDRAGNVYVTGRDQNSQLNPVGYTVSNYDYATVKYDASGREVWVARFDDLSHGDDFGRLIALDAADNVYVSGYSAWNGGSDVSAYDYVTIKYAQVVPTAPRLAGSGSLPSGQFQLMLIGTVGQSYTIQASEDLVNWTDLTNFVSTTGTNQFTDILAASFNRRFYRALSP